MWYDILSDNGHSLTLSA